MTGLVSPDRWTCPTCNRTEVPEARDAAALQKAIRRVQLRHAREHEAAERRAMAAGAQ